MALYVVGVAVLGMAQMAPAALELGVWGIGRALHATYWLVWSRHESRRQEERLRLLVREELRNCLRGEAHHMSSGEDQNFVDVH